MQKILIVHILIGISRASEKHAFFLVYPWWYIKKFLHRKVAVNMEGLKMKCGRRQYPASLK